MLPSTSTAAFLTGSPPLPSISRRVQEQGRSVGDEQLMCTPPFSAACAGDDRVRERSRCRRSRRGRRRRAAGSPPRTTSSRSYGLPPISGSVAHAVPPGVPVSMHEPGRQRVEVREEGDDLGDAPDHLRGRVALADLLVDVRAQLERLGVGDLVARHDPGAERRRRVEVLAGAERVLEAALRDAARPGGRAP